MRERSFPNNWYEGSRNTAPTLDDLDELFGEPVHEWGDDGIPDEPFLVDRRPSMSLTKWEREVTAIAERHGLIYTKPTGGRNHGKLRDPQTNRTLPVSCSPRDEGRASIHVNNDCRKLVGMRPQPVSSNGDQPLTVDEIREVEATELTDEQLDELTTPEPVVEAEPVEPPARPKRRIIARSHDEKPKKLVLAELTRVVGEIDELEQWLTERRVEADQLVGRGRKLGLTASAMAAAANRSAPWVQTCLRRLAGVAANKPYGKGTP